MNNIKNHIKIDLVAPNAIKCSYSKSVMRSAAMQSRIGRDIGAVVSSYAKLVANRNNYTNEDITKAEVEYALAENSVIDAAKGKGSKVTPTIAPERGMIAMHNMAKNREEWQAFLRDTDSADIINAAVYGGPCEQGAVALFDAGVDYNLGISGNEVPCLNENDSLNYSALRGEGKYVEQFAMYLHDVAPATIDKLIARHGAQTVSRIGEVGRREGLSTAEAMIAAVAKKVGQANAYTTAFEYAFERTDNWLIQKAVLNVFGGDMVDRLKKFNPFDGIDFDLYDYENEEDENDL